MWKRKKLTKRLSVISQFRRHQRLRARLAGRQLEACKARQAREQLAAVREAQNAL